MCSGGATRAVSVAPLGVGWESSHQEVRPQSASQRVVSCDEAGVVSVAADICM